VRDLRDLETDAFLAQAELLAQLQALPAWAAWVTLLRDMRQAALEQLAQSTPDDFRYWQGAVASLGEIIDRPARMTATAADFQRAEEEEKRVIRPELRAAMGLGVDTEGDF
jgi:hypothetical protein